MTSRTPKNPAPGMPPHGAVPVPPCRGMGSPAADQRPLSAAGRGPKTPEPGETRGSVEPGTGKQPVPVAGDQPAAGTGANPRVWVISLPPGTPILTGNHRLHYHARNRRVKDLYQVIADLVMVHRIPRVDYADVRVTYKPPPRWRHMRHPLASDRVEDSDALWPTSKALIDGLTRAGVFTSDTHKHVRVSECEVLDDIHPMGAVQLTITEVTR